MSKQNEHDVYLIPPNFIEGGTVFGGMLKLRNVIEAGIIALIIGFPICMLDVSLTAKIVILCLTALPIGIFAVIGIYGEALSSFVFNFFKFLKLRQWPFVMRSHCLALRLRLSGRMISMLGIRKSVEY